MSTEAKTTPTITAPKVFLLSTIIGTVIIAVLITMATTLLRSFDKNEGIDGFFKYERPILLINFVMYVVNMIIAVWVYLRRRQGLYLIYAATLFIFFVNTDYFWLINKYFLVKYSLLRPTDVLPIYNVKAVVLNIFGIAFTAVVFVVARAMKRTNKKDVLST